MANPGSWEAAQTLVAPSYQLRVGPRGELTVEIGADRYSLESYFSYPGVTIGTNAFDGNGTGEAGWAPAVTRSAAACVRIEAAGTYYGLVRTVTLEGHRVASRTR